MTTAVLEQPKRVVAVTERARITDPSVLVDLTRCTGCKGCVVSCKEWAGLRYIVPPFDPELGSPPLSGTTYTSLRFQVVENGAGGIDWSFSKDQCMHCLNPSCAAACPVDALHTTDEGAVVYDSDKCMGCRYCQLGCPFRIPKFEWAELNPEIRKCDFCADRLQADLEPRCAGACPTGALQYGNRGDLLAEARSRLGAEPQRYLPHIYGEVENGGTRWLYLSGVPFEELGYRSVPRENPAVTADRNMKAVPIVAGAAAIVFGGSSWFARRRMAVRDAGRMESQPGDPAGNEEGGPE